MCRRPPSTTRRTRGRGHRPRPARSVPAPRSRSDGGRGSARPRGAARAGSRWRSRPARASASRRSRPRAKGTGFSNLPEVRARRFAAENRKWWTLAAVAVGLFMIMLDNTVVNVALPSIRKDLGISISELEWVVNAYALTFGVLMLSGGKLADLLGRRAIFVVGLVIFTGASLWCGLAGGAGSLIAARTLQGVGAALMNPATLSLFAAAVVLLATFVVLEQRQRLPMLDLSLFRNASFSGANVAMLLIGLAMFGVFFYNSLFLQNVLGYSAIRTGATFLPMTVLIILVAPAAGKISDRIGPRWLMGAGMALLTGSLLLFGTLDASSSFWNILPALLLGGVGLATVMAPTTAAAMASVPVDKAGVGSAVINSMRQVGGSLGIAIIGAALG